jgi:AraC-like DNA-binding protein
VVVEDAGTPASREDGGGLVASRGEDLGHRLLRTASVSDVADRLGYGSPAFTAAFTRAFGMPPSRFTASGAGGGPGRGSPFLHTGGPRANRPGRAVVAPGTERTVSRRTRDERCCSAAGDSGILMSDPG